jgi:uncharacterized membrane protein YidH (DUF202 family)
MEKNLDTFILSVQQNILTPVMTLLALGAFVLFVFGVVNFIRNAESDEKRSEGQKHMLWGIIGLVIIFGANAIIALIANTVGVSTP